MHLTYGHDIPNYEKCKRLSNDYRWITMNMCNPNFTARGLFSIHHNEDLSDFIGLVHDESEDPQELSLTAQEFSKALINDIAPRI